MDIDKNIEDAELLVSDEIIKQIAKMSHNSINGKIYFQKTIKDCYTLTLEYKMKNGELVSEKIISTKNFNKFKEWQSYFFNKFNHYGGIIEIDKKLLNLY